MQKVLVIDDQPEILEIIEMIISNYFDCEIHTANNVNDALELCSQNKYNVICSDYVMPNLNGADLIKKLRQGDTFNSDTEILIVTGNEDMVDKSICNMGKIKIVNKLEEVKNLVDLFSNYLEN